MKDISLPTIVLSSSSPARQALMKTLELPFVTYVPDVDETILPGEDIPTTVRRLAIAKVTKAKTNFQDALIIGCDQLGMVNQAMLGKPQNHTEAVQQLKLQSGNCITFYTAVALYDTRTLHIQHEIVNYQVQFRDLSDREIEDYLQKAKPYHCAGSLSIEGLGITLIDKLSGDDFTALIGLPLIALSRMLRKAGVYLYGSHPVSNSNSAVQ